MQTVSLIVSIVALVTTIFGTLFGYRYISMRMRANRFIGAVLDYTKEIVWEDSFPSNKARLAHEVVKKLHDDLPEKIESCVSPEDVDRIDHALDAARIYYWVRALEGATIAEIEKLLQERDQRVKDHRARSASLDYVLHEVVLATKSGLTISDCQLEDLKMQCESDIAELEKHTATVMVFTRWNNAV